MELIKKIKETETQAQEIIEQAKIKAAERADKGRQNRLDIMAKAEQERKRAIEAAVSKGESEGLAEIKILRAEAEKKRLELRSKAGKKMSGAAAKVMNYLRG